MKQKAPFDVNICLTPKSAVYNLIQIKIFFIRLFHKNSLFAKLLFDKL